MKPSPLRANFHAPANTLIEIDILRGSFLEDRPVGSEGRKEAMETGPFGNCPANKSKHAPSQFGGLPGLFPRWGFWVVRCVDFLHTYRLLYLHVAALGPFRTGRWSQELMN